MYKVLSSDSDCYINNRIIAGRSCKKSNTGAAATLDLFKIYGLTFTTGSANIEYSRALIHFNLEHLKNLHENNLIDIDHQSFFAKLKLKDVYGGQVTPEKFKLIINPLSSSFTEGLGKDVIKYEDIDVCNFISGSMNEFDSPVNWIAEGCSAPGSPGDICDYFTGSFQKEQVFKTGEEDLEVDVTDVIKSILNNEIPDSGFRIAFDPVLESNERTYFVKRFASRHAFDESKRPQLIFGFDDSIKDTSEFLYTDNNTSFVIYNYENGELSNFKDSSNAEITGNDSLLLKLTIPPSGTYYFTGSQYAIGSVMNNGIYLATGSIPQDARFAAAQISSGSKIKASCQWMTLAEDKNLAPNKNKFIFPKPIFDTKISNKNFVVSANVKDEYLFSESNSDLIRVNVFDPESPAIIASRVSHPSPGGYQGVIQDAAYQIRENNSKEVLIPFDFEKGSTRLSSDNLGMFFHLDTSNLFKNRSYVIDIALKFGNKTQVYSNISSVFKIRDF
jgi:hypothetical protein